MYSNSSIIKNSTSLIEWIEKSMVLQIYKMALQ